jgi:hypothetical protein
MFPTRGTCHGVFLLVRSACSAPRRSLNEWIAFARSMPTVMAAAINLDALAASLCTCGLASLQNGKINLDERLVRVGEAATDEVLMSIAALLLRLDPPPWLHSAVASGFFRPELVPFPDLKALEWLGQDIEPLLAAVKDESAEDDAFRTWLGSVGESLVVALERCRGASVRHVSLVSDRFGYDVESLSSGRRRLEVKTSVVGSEHRLFLTRNEVTAAARHFAEWFLIQVVLKPEALAAPNVTPCHVERMRQLPSSSVIGVLPQDSIHCRWVETVELATRDMDWVLYFPNTAIPEQWSTPRR